MPKILDQFGRPVPLSRKPRYKVRAAGQLHASYDAAKTTDENSRHWANADNLSPARAANPDVRKHLRERARYEIGENNSFGKGIVLTLANDTIRRGPRLQVLTPDPAINRQIEEPFNRWARAIRLASKLRTMRMARAIDGEIFAVQSTNPRLPTPVQLDIHLAEADEFATPFFYLSDETRAVDGIRFDAFGNPVEYHRLKSHPGSADAAGLFGEFDRLPAADVVHYFREDRPGQRRGIPEVTPALPLFAMLRRFILATIAAAETAAEVAGVMYTDSPAIAEPDDVDAMDAVEFEMRSMLTLPAGWKMGQVKSEHPATTFEMFRNAIIGEVARCVLMPVNKALGNSAGYTFASGKLDRDAYLEAIETDRDEIECCALDRFLLWYLDEAALISGFLPPGIGALADLPHLWQWDGFRETDPAKQANADATYWERGLLSDADILHRRGVDPDEHYARIARQYAARAELGMPQPSQADVPAPAEPPEGS